MLVAKLSGREQRVPRSRGQRVIMSRREDHGVRRREHAAGWSFKGSGHLADHCPQPQNNMSFLSEICQRPHCMDE